MIKLFSKTKHFFSEHKVGKCISLTLLGILAFVMGGIVLLGITIGAVKSFRRAIKNKSSMPHRLLATFCAGLAGGVLALLGGWIGEIAGILIGLPYTGFVLGGMIGAGVAAIVGKRIAGKLVLSSKKANINKSKSKKIKKVSKAHKFASKRKFHLGAV